MEGGDHRETGSDEIVGVRAGAGVLAEHLFDGGGEQRAVGARDSGDAIGLGNLVIEFFDGCRLKRTLQSR